MALILPHHHETLFMFRYDSGGLNGRSTKRITRRSRSVEVWWRLHLHDSDFYYRLLVVRLRSLLEQDFQDFPRLQVNPEKSCKSCHQFFRFLPDRKIRPYSTAIKLLWLVEQDTRAHHHGSNRILRHRGAQFQFALQTVLESF